MYCLKSLLGELSSSGVIPLGEDSWKLVAGFPWSLPHVPFLRANFVLYPFAVINHSCEYYYMSNTVSFARESPNLTGNLSVLGTPLNQPSHTGQSMTQTFNYVFVFQPNHHLSVQGFISFVMPSLVTAD